MDLIKKYLLVTCAISLLYQGSALANEKNYPLDIKNIKAVVEAFRVSIINKDKAQFVDLFHSEPVPWLGVASKQTIALAPPPKEGQRKRTKVMNGDYLSFIDWIVKTPKSIEEKFWDVKIINDEDIASVHFKYSFHQDDKKTNWGDEAWHLVRTEQGWKIASVIYSITIK